MIVSAEKGLFCLTMIPNSGAPNQWRSMWIWNTTTFQMSLHIKKSRSNKCFFLHTKIQVPYRHLLGTFQFLAGAPKIWTKLPPLTVQNTVFNWKSNGYWRLKGSDQWKMRGVEKLPSVRRLYRTVVIDVCLFFYEAVVFSSTYFRFLFVMLN